MGVRTADTMKTSARARFINSCSDDALGWITVCSLSHGMDMERMRVCVSLIYSVWSYKPRFLEPRMGSLSMVIRSGYYLALARLDVLISLTVLA
jgi:hypothetical protein